VKCSVVWVGKEKVRVRTPGFERATADENLLNRLPVGVAVVDRHYDIQTINTAARRLLSIRGAAVGENILHAIQDVPYAEIRNAIDQAFRDGISTTGEFSVEEATTGETRYIQLICNPQRDENTRALAETVTIVVNDVTEIGRARREAEKSLEETRTEYERFLREAEAGIRGGTAPSTVPSIPGTWR